VSDRKRGRRLGPVVASAIHQRTLAVLERAKDASADQE